MPHISIEEHKRLFNIVTLESRINELERLKAKEKDNGLIYNIEIRLLRLKDQLKALTDNQNPNDVLENMLYNSRE
jgi:hypothetical protein